MFIARVLKLEPSLLTYVITLSINYNLKNKGFTNYIRTSGTRDLRTPVATPLQPPRTLYLVSIIENFPKITLVGPTLRHLYPHR